MEIQYWWAIFEVDERDYLLGSNNSSSIIEIEKLPKINGSVIEYNQLEFEKEFWRNMCTEYAPQGMFQIIVEEN